MKILPYILSPVFEYTPKSTYLLSIVQTIPNSEKWIACNYGNIKIIDLDTRIWDAFWDTEEWEYCENIDVSQILYDWVKDEYEEFIMFIVNCINRGYYIYTEVNTKYIPAYNSKVDYAHNLIIYGYDEAEQIIFFSDFFAGGKYGVRTCSFSEINKAFKELIVTKAYKEYNYKKVEILKIIDGNCKFQIDELIKSTKEFLNKKSTNAKEQYGIECFRYIANEVLYERANKRYFSLIVAIIKLWKLRISVINHEYITNYNYDELKLLLEDMLKMAMENQLLLIKTSLIDDDNVKKAYITKMFYNIKLIEEKLQYICITIINAKYIRIK